MVFTVDRLQLGAAEIVRVVEWLGELAPVNIMFPDTSEEFWRDAANLSPYFYQPAKKLYRAAVQTWVVRLHGTITLIDTGIGDGRDRPQIPRFSHLHTNFLHQLEAAGVAPADVDVVINTHIHYDHVGWNTHQPTVNASWTPSFPNADYVIPSADLDYFHPDNTDGMRAPRSEDEARRFAGIQLVYADSITPVVQAGQVTAWRHTLDLPGGLHLREAPGHTPGSSILWLDSGPGAVFVGDLLHSPVQVERPEDSCAFDLNKDQARISRRDVVSRVAGTNTLVFPAHFPGRGAFTAEAVPSSLSADSAGDNDTSPDVFRVSSWSALPPI